MTTLKNLKTVEKVISKILEKQLLFDVCPIENEDGKMVIVNSNNKEITFIIGNNDTFPYKFDQVHFVAENKQKNFLLGVTETEEGIGNLLDWILSDKDAMNVSDLTITSTLV